MVVGRMYSPHTYAISYTRDNSPRCVRGMPFICSSAGVWFIVQRVWIFGARRKREGSFHSTEIAPLRQVPLLHTPTHQVERFRIGHTTLVQFVTRLEMKCCVVH